MAQVYACYHHVDKAGFPLVDFHLSSTAASVEALLEGNTEQAPNCNADAATPTVDSSIFLFLGAFLWFACFVQLNRHGSAPCK